MNPYASLAGKKSRDLPRSLVLGRLCGTAVVRGAPGTLPLGRFCWTRSRVTVLAFIWRLGLVVIVVLSFDGSSVWNGQRGIVFGSLDAVRRRTGFILVLNLDVRLRFVDGLLLWAVKKVGNVVLVGRAINGHEKRGRVVANLANVFADGVAF